MATTSFRTVDQYIATFPERVQEMLQTVRAAIRAAAPDAEEGISYQIPAYKFERVAVYFGGFKNHYSLFAVNSESLTETFKEELARYTVTKGTIKFPIGEPVPEELVRRIVRHRVEEHLGRPQQKHPETQSSRP